MKPNRQHVTGHHPYARRSLCLAAGLLPFLTSIASADDCRPRLRASLALAMIDRVALVHLKIKNKDAVFILDTGAEATILSTVGADRLGLNHDTAYPRRLRGFNGGLVSGAAELPDVTVAGAHVGSFRVLLGEIRLPVLAGVTPDGFLGADILSAFELDLDFSHDQIRLFDKLFCAIAAPDWGGRSFTLVEANRSLHNHLFFWVTLDGHRFAAFFDTGAQHSVIDARSAQIAGMDRAAVANGPATTLRGFSSSTGVAAPLYRFHELALGSMKVAAPAFLVAPLGLVDGDIVLGMDYLKNRRLWLSYRSHRVFISNPS